MQQRLFKGHHWGDHPGGVHKRRTAENQKQRSQIVALHQSGSAYSGRKLRGRQKGKQTHVVFRAGPYAVEAKRAIEIARLLRDKKFCLTSRALGAPTDAVVCCTSCTEMRIARGNLQRRDERGDKLKLTDRTNVFTK